MQLALAAGRLPHCWALTPVHTQGTSGSGGIHAALSKGSRTCLLMLLHSQAGAQALALPCSSFPLFQHFSPHSLPRTCTARWPDPGSANQTPLVCWAHGRRAAPHATRDLFHSPSLAQPGGSALGLWPTHMGSPATAAWGAGRSFFLFPAGEWEDGSTCWLERGAPLSQGPVPVQPQLQ